ncbi:hypothetical protein HGRIS_009494 [Hohenbuehelia grisea]|uniref:CID domain-containing protein n=1 Tax=Hohenbuehelia grisea TaxID=104357 RepID=A0ABR3J1S0_9AGAR
MTRHRLAPQLRKFSLSSPHSLSIHGSMTNISFFVHCSQVPPWMKLPSFYLLDAISKNVYEPYARLFAAFVIPLFLESYHLVDPQTRSKMEEMLLTWRTGSPTGKELFGVAPQASIERGIWGSSGNSNASGGFHAPVGRITKAQVLSELEFTLGQKERALQTNPYDETARNHINILHQLRKLVEAGVSQEELQQILTQLRSLLRSVAPPPPPPPAVPAPQPWSAPPTYPGSTQMPAAPAAPYGQPPSHLRTYSAASLGDVKVEGPSSAASLSLPMTSTDAVASIPSVNSIQNLLSTLVKAGVVSATATPPEAGSSRQHTPTAKTEEIDLAKESARTYRKALLAQKIKLTTSDITKKRLDVVSLLYNQLPSQCKQCGIRFAGSALGKKALQDHLDVHFRQNRKANQNIGRGHSRSWFVGTDDWITDASHDIKGKGREDGARPLNSKAAAAAEVAQREAELRAQYVVVPPGDEAKTISCPICKESLKSEFLEDDEDWVWKNAVMKDGRVSSRLCRHLHV